MAQEPNQSLPTAVVMLRPHFTLPGGAGRTILEVGKRLAATRKVVIITQKVNDAVRSEYPVIEFVSLNGPITGQVAFWLLWPVRFVLAIDCTVENVTDTLKRVLADPATLKRWSTAARERVAARFTWDNTANTIQQFL